MPSRPDARALADRRRRQIHAVRTRVATIGVAAFLALWAGLFVQLATGHDPALKNTSPVAVVQSADPAATDTSSGSDASTLASADSDGDDSAYADSGAVVTRQS